jgi:chromatin assembly factor 1 subunit B
MTVPENQEKGGGAGRQFRMWIDESLSFFFRRLTFSPDGNLLVVPAGRYENGDKATNMTYIFTKSNLAK